MVDTTSHMMESSIESSKTAQAGGELVQKQQVKCKRLSRQ